jgi:hypothetical protein
VEGRAMTDAPVHRIIIKRGAVGAGFDVTVEPPVDDHPLDREFDNHRSAYGYASGLRMTLGFPVIDQAGEPS